MKKVKLLLDDGPDYNVGNYKSVRGKLFNGRRALISGIEIVFTLSLINSLVWQNLIIYSGKPLRLNVMVMVVKINSGRHIKLITEMPKQL